MRNFHQRGIDTRGRISGKIKTICPQCNDTRGHKGNKSLSVDLDKGLCYCHHCGYKLYVPDDAFRTRSHPDWTGRWSCFATCSQRAIVSKSLLVASFGWLDIKRSQ